jgi:predicted ATPase/class 3 adenylate cyclase/DNA-binding XRE family transcriptional regulator
MEKHSFGTWLRRRRKALDLTQDGLADRVGCSVALIRKIESEERRPSAQIVERLAEIFDIPTDERAAFSRFARGDWQAAPTGGVENVPWLGSPSREQIEPAHPLTHLATFLFTDIEGSAKLWETAPEKMKAALQRHHAILQEAIVSNSGTVFQIVGDAFCAAFPTVLSAVSAAITAQQVLYREPWDLPFPIRVRMGIHTGEAERTSNNEYASNPTLNRVARILSAAHGGQVLLSLATTDLVKDSLPANTELRDMGQHSLKNLIHPEHLFQMNIQGLPSEFPPLNTLTHRHNLPIQLTSFIGREKEQNEVVDLLTKNRLVTLTGAGGIGKTRLSIEAARRVLSQFQDGTFFVALASLPSDDPNLIVLAVVQALGFVEDSNRPAEQQLREGIGSKRMLLVLDNCEHLIEGVATLASDLLSACPYIKIIATSRESLRIPGEWLYAVPTLGIMPEEDAPLDLETASKSPMLMLFTERARAVRSDFTLTKDNFQAVTSICMKLDGLPLAIELIAARIRLMPPHALLERLSGQFILTADGMRSISERQKTLNNAIRWSYNLLPLEEQKLFAYLSVFSGGFTLEAVEAMFSQKAFGKPLDPLIASLLDKSLLKLATDLEASRETRYTMLVTIQEYARERLRDMEEEAEIRNLHLDYFLTLAEKAGRELLGHHQLEWLRQLDSERDNLRTALDWAIETGQTETALHIVRGLHWFWLILSNFNEGRQWFQRVLEMPDAPSYPGAHAEVLTQMAHQTFLQVRPSDSKPYSEQALSIARAQQDKHNTARALVFLGIALTDEKNFTAAQSAFEESKQLFQEVHDEWGTSFAMMVHATLFWQQEEWATALSLSQQALTGFQKLGHRYYQHVTLRHIGIAFVHLGDLTNGRAALREALALAQQLQSKQDIAKAFYRFAEIAQRLNQPVRVVRLHWASRNISESIGAWQQEDESWFEDLLAPFRAALGESGFAAAVEQGRAMTMEQAIAYALEDSE